MDLAYFAIKQLKEQSNIPEVQLQDILNVINEGNHWEDFTKERMPEVFKALAEKFEKVVMKLQQAETKRERLLKALKQTKGQLEEFTEDISSAKADKTKAQLIHADYAKLQADVGELMVKYQLMTELKQRNEELLHNQARQNKELADLKASNFQLSLQKKEASVKLEELREKVIDQNAELQCARQAIAEAGPTVTKKFQNLRSSSPQVQNSRSSRLNYSTNVLHFRPTL